MYYLDKYYGIKRDLRFISVLDKIIETDEDHTSRYAWESQALKVAEQFAAVHEKENVIDILLNETAGVASRAVVFEVNDILVSGWKGRGISVDGFEDRIKEASIYDTVLKKNAGLMAINVKEQYGGSEAGVIAFSLAVTEIGKACSSTGVTMSVNNMVCEVIQAIGTEEQKKAYIPKIASGEYYAGGFGLTETMAGSDPSGMRTTAVLDGDSWVLNGTKIFITSAEYAGVFVVWAVTDPKAPKGKGISTFLVENGIKGFSVGRAEHKMGQHASGTNELLFEDCRIPKTALMGTRGCDQACRSHNGHRTSSPTNMR